MAVDVGAWSTDPGAWLASLGVVSTWALGVVRLRRHVGGRRFLTPVRLAVGAAAVVVLVLALMSPLDAAATTSVAAHMVQHLLLLLVVAPGLVVGRVVAVVGAAAPRRSREVRRRRVGPPTVRPLLAAALLAVTWWTWHVPALYRAAVTTPWLHGLEHLTMLGAAWLLWSVLVDTTDRLPGAGRVAAALVTALHMTAMAALLSLVDTPWLFAPEPGARDPLIDQALAGGLLWFPGGLVWVVAGAVLTWRWLVADDAGSRARDLPTATTTTRSAP